MLPENHRESEAPQADAVQTVLAAVFFTVWIADSFWLNWTTGYSHWYPA